MSNTPTTPTTTPAIYGQLAAIFSDITAIGKDRKNASQGYAFRGIDDMYNDLHGLFAKHKVFVLPRVTDCQRDEVTNKSGNLLKYIYLTVEYRFTSGIDGSEVVCVSVGEAMDSGDKASNKAMSSAFKYALMQTLMIPTEEDKDVENATPELGKAADQPMRKAATSPQWNKLPDGGAAADDKPWLNEQQFQAMMQAIESGKGAHVLAKMENYKMKRDYREQLTQALVAADQALA